MFIDITPSDRRSLQPRSAQPPRRGFMVGSAANHRTRLAPFEHPVIRATATRSLATSPTISTASRGLKTGSRRFLGERYRPDHLADTSIGVGV